MAKHKAKPFKLDCNHTVWYILPPRASDYLWCIKCNASRGLDKTVYTPVIYDGYTQYKVQGTWSGECNECQEQFTATRQDKIEPLLFQHIAIEHGESTLLTYQNGTYTTIPKDALPPF